MITGWQIGAARELLGLSRANMADSFDVLPSTITRAEATDEEPAITFAQATRTQNMFEKRELDQAELRHQMDLAIAATIVENKFKA